jgi:hypothetical protein
LHGNTILHEYLFFRGFFGHRYDLYSSSKPHEGYHILKNIVEEKQRNGGSYFVFTSNVDGYFEQVLSPNHIVECHGSINHLQCLDSCTDDIWPAKESNIFPLKVDMETLRAQEPLPMCRNCKKRIARPNILMFGDWSFLPYRTENQNEKHKMWLDKSKYVCNNGDGKFVVIELGAGEAIRTVRYQSERSAYLHHGALIRINPRDHNVPPMDNVESIVIPMGAKDALKAIYNELS